jgi:hypothetical protein
MVFGLVRENKVFDDSFSCIVGLAYPKMKAGGDWHVPFFDRLIEQGINTFAFDFNESAPKLVFGPTYTEEEVDWFPVVNQLFWSLNLNRVFIKFSDRELTLCDKSDGRKCSIAPDSGTSAVTFPTWAFN